MSWRDTVKEDAPKSWRDTISDEGSEPTTPLDSKATALAVGGLQGGLMSFGDELGAAGSTVMNAISGFSGPLAGGSLEDLIEDYQRSRDSLRSEFAKTQKANPKTFAAAEIGGSLLSGGAFGGAPKTLGQAAVQGASMGTAAGLGGSNADLLEGDLKGAAIDTAKGTLIGAGAGVVGYGVSKGIGAISDSLKNAPAALKDTADLASAKALGAERATIKSIGLDKVKQIGRYGLDEGVVSPFASTEELLARNEALKSKGGQMMGDVYGAIDDAGANTFSPLEAATEVENNIGGFWRSPINKGETSQLENTLESVLMRGDKNIPLTEAQVLKEELGKVANWKNKLVITDKEQMARDAYNVVSAEIDKATQIGAEAIGSPALLETLKKGKSLYSNASGAEKLLENKASSEIGNKAFGITDWSLIAPTVAAAPFTGGISAVVGLVGLAIKKGAEKYGNQIVAVGADRLADVLSKTPAIFGKFAPVLQEAAQRGGQSLAVTHYLLQQTDPAYREQTKKALGDE